MKNLMIAEALARHICAAHNAVVAREDANRSQFKTLIPLTERTLKNHFDAMIVLVTL